MIYLDGNSLGPLPKAAPERIARAVRDEWGEGLIRSWNTAGWFELPQRLGDKIATLIGAGAGEVVATDSTSVNLFKVLSAALSITAADAPHPLHGIAWLRSWQVESAGPDEAVLRALPARTKVSALRRDSAGRRLAHLRPGGTAGWPNEDHDVPCHTNESFA